MRDLQRRSGPACEEDHAMDKVVAIVAMLAVLFLISRGLPGRVWPVILAATLAVVLAVVLAEQYGLWPAGWTVR
jgi:hypothetical protein